MTEVELLERLAAIRDATTDPDARRALNELMRDRWASTPAAPLIAIGVQS